jgi:hypothetical protein
VRRRLALGFGSALVLVLLAWPAALAEYRGSDLLGNVSPESQVGGGLVDRYPLSAYALDYHVDVGVTDPEGVAPMIAQWAAAQLWSLSSFLVKTVIDLFTWAFSLDLLNGVDGALAPIAQAISSLYENVIGQAWMVAAIVVAGIWGIWKALVQRRYTETAGGLALSVVFVVIALFFVYQPERTVGEASRWTNTLSLALLSGANRGSLDDPEQAKRQVADHLFETLVYRPWVALEFGGLSHCVDTDRTDGDGFPRPVGPHDAARDVCRDHVRAGRDGHGGYAPRFLHRPAGSAERTAEYDALRKGETPSGAQFAGYRVDKADSPAVDVQQAGGAFQRLTFSAVILVGSLGAVMLLGFLSLAVILAQVVALVLLGFAPVALVIGIFPGAGHEFFRGWLAKLATAVFIKALYSLVIAIVVAVSAALAGSTGSLGFLFAFGLQTVFFWAIFLYRKQITARLVGATTGAGLNERTPRMTVVQKGAHAAARPMTALMSVPRRGDHDQGGRQESALAGGEPASAPESAASPSHAGTHVSLAPPLVVAGAANGNGHGNGTAAKLTAGNPLHANGASANGASANGNGNGGVPQPHPASGSTSGHAPAATAVPGPVADRRDPAAEATPRTSHEDVMRRARELRERERAVGLGDEEPRG